MREEIERKVREAVGLTSFGAEGDETPIEIVPDVVLDDAEPGGNGRSRETASG